MAQNFIRLVDGERITGTAGLVGRTFKLGSQADDGASRTQYTSGTSFDSDGANLAIYVNGSLMISPLDSATYKEYTILDTDTIQFTSKCSQFDKIIMLVYSN